MFPKTKMLSREKPKEVLHIQPTEESCSSLQSGMKLELKPIKLLQMEEQHQIRFSLWPSMSQQHVPAGPASREFNASTVGLLTLATSADVVPLDFMEMVGYA